MTPTTSTLQAHCPDIHCEGCAGSIRRSLGRLPGVQSVSVDVLSKDVTVQYDTALTTAAALHERLTVAGFPADTGEHG